jgi:hypothetical protein
MLCACRASCSRAPADTLCLSADVCIAAAVRTPMGSFQGSLASFSATDLGALAIKGDCQHTQRSWQSMHKLGTGGISAAGGRQSHAQLPQHTQTLTASCCRCPCMLLCSRP